VASVDFILDFGVFYKGFPIELSIWVESWGFVTIFVTYLCFADVGTKISPKPVIPNNPPLHRLCRCRGYEDVRPLAHQRIRTSRKGGKGDVIFCIAAGFSKMMGWSLHRPCRCRDGYVLLIS